MRITINEDTTFLISDELGNVPEGAELGLYHEDMRFLCFYELTLDGQPPLLLTARATDYYAATHFLTNPALPKVPRGLLGIVRRRLARSAEPPSSHPVCSTCVSGGCGWGSAEPTWR